METVGRMQTQRSSHGLFVLQSSMLGSVIGVRTKILAGVCTTKGVFKNRNEDNFLLNTKILKGEGNYNKKSIISKDFGIFAICDGMGGAKNGKEASSFVVSRLSERRECLQDKNNLEGLNDIIRDLNNSLVKKYKNKAGTTLALVIITKEKIYYANVGDSRIYFFIDNRLYKVSEEHNQAREFEKDGFNVQGGKNILTQYIGIPEEEMVIEAHCGEWRYHGDEIMAVLCSDGVTEGISEEMLAGILNTNKKKPAVFLADFIVNSAIKGKSKDNITSMVIKIK